MMLKSKFENREKLVQTQTFEFKFGMQGLSVNKLNFEQNLEKVGK